MSEKKPTKPGSRWLGDSFTGRPVPRYRKGLDILPNTTESPGWRKGARVTKR